MKRLLSEPEAWREIARRIVAGEWERAGLCNEVSRLWIVDRAIDERTRHLMRLRIAGHMIALNVSRVNYGYSPYAFGVGRYPEARALAALWMALEAEAEAAP